MKPSQVSTLAALDSTRLRSELAKYFHAVADEIENCRTYGGHGEQMAVFASTTKVKGTPLAELIGTEKLPAEDWEKIRQQVVQGGKHIIDLRGRSSFQSPAYLSIEMIAAAMGGNPFTWPAGVYLSDGKFNHILMAMETILDRSGVHYNPVYGTPEEDKELLGEDTDWREEAMDGLSILPTLTGKGEQRQHDFLYWEFHEENGRQAVRAGDWKLIRQNIKNGNPTHELYNIAEDPHEDKELERSYKHLCDLRDEVIAMGIIPPVSEWNKLNKNIE